MALLQVRCRRNISPAHRRCLARFRYFSRRGRHLPVRRLRRSSLQAHRSRLPQRGVWRWHDGFLQSRRLVFSGCDRGQASHGLGAVLSSRRRDRFAPARRRQRTRRIEVYHKDRGSLSVRDYRQCRSHGESAATAATGRSTEREAFSNIRANEEQEAKTEKTVNNKLRN